MQKLQACKENIQFQIQNAMQKTSRKYDFKNILSNLQHQNHRIITIDGTSWLPKFPHMKPLKWEKNSANPKKLGESQKSFKNS